MDQFPSNSHKATGPSTPKEKEEKKIEKVVTGEVIKKPKSLGRKFKELIVGDGSKGALNYVFGDVLIPALKNMFVDAVSKGAERAVYGDSVSSRRSRMDYGRPRIQYNSPIDRREPRGRSVSLPDQPPHRVGGRRYDAGEIILVSREEAELVLERLADILDKYDVATVADLHDLVGLPTAHVDNKWGWFSLGYASVRQIRDGYILDLPQAEPIPS
jgi:hypothetical protein